MKTEPSDGPAVRRRGQGDSGKQELVKDRFLACPWNEPGFVLLSSDLPLALKERLDGPLCHRSTSGMS